MQLEHHNTDFPKLGFDIVLVCDGVNSPANMGSLLRVADSFGAKKVVFANSQIDINSPRLKRTARSAQKWVSIEDNIDTAESLKQYVLEGYVPIALEISEKSIPLQEINFLHLERIVLVIGDESTGVSDPVLEICEIQAHITMFGKNSSMNVSQATSIALYEITKQLKNGN